MGPAGHRRLEARRGGRYRHGVRGEAVELLVKVARSNKEDAEGSYDYIRQINYFEPTSKVSRAKLRNLIAMEQQAGTIAKGFDIEKLAMPGLTELVD